MYTDFTANEPARTLHFTPTNSSKSFLSEGQAQTGELSEVSNPEPSCSQVDGILDDPGLGHVLASEFRSWNQPHQNLKAQELGRNGTYRKTKSLLTTMTISHVTTLAVKTAALGFENDHMLCLNYMNSSIDQRLL